MPEPFILLLMVGVFLALAVGFKLPLGVGMALAAVAGALVDGHGLALRHLVEGAFGFFDLILIIASAMIFMEVLRESGLLAALVAAILRGFHRRKVGLLLLVMGLLMFPGMITGSSLAAVLTVGPLIAPVLMKLGLSRPKTAAFIASGAVLGMIAPPVNIPVMIMGGGVDMPYAGLTLPLLVIVLPPAIAIPLLLGLRDLRVVSKEELRELLPPLEAKRNGILLALPLALVVLLLVLQNLGLPGISGLGLPAIFFIGSLIGIVSGRRFNFWRTTAKAVEEALPILSILAGVGMFIQVMTLTGARGFTVLSFLSLPPALLIAGMAVSLPLFGGVSSFGSASVLGVPFLLAFVDGNVLITAAALSAIVSIGDLMPPAAVAARFSAQVAGEPKLFEVLRRAFLPALLILGAGISVLLLAPVLGKVI